MCLITGFITVGPVTIISEAKIIEISQGRPAIYAAEKKPTENITITESTISFKRTDFNDVICLILRERPPSKRIMATNIVIIILRPSPRAPGLSIPSTLGPNIIPIAK